MIILACLLGTTMVGVCLMLIFGEYLPKLWFNRRPIERCLPFAGLLRIAERILHPLVWLTTVACWTCS